MLYPPPHGKKHHYGLQYCPECLSCFGIFRRSWRFLFSVGCAVHGRLLIDKCPHCENPTRIPFGDRVGIFSRFMCVRCGYDFRESPPAPQLPKRVVDLQQKCLELCDPSNHASSDTTGYLTALWAIVTFCAEFDPWFIAFMVWEYRYRQRKNSSLPTAELRTIEGLPVGYRARLLECASWCMEDWPHNFLRIIRTCRASDYKLQASVMSHSVQAGAGPEFPTHPTGAPIWPNASRPPGHGRIRGSLLAEDGPIARVSNEIRVSPSRHFSAETYRPAIEEAIASMYERFSLELTACVVLFARYAEEKLAQAVDRGVKQYVLFGAGLNTYAFRNQFENLKVFEIDDPATQQWKRGIMALGGVYKPACLNHVPVNFERGDFAHQLERSRLDVGVSTVFASLGVMPFMTHQVFRAFLDLVRSFPIGSGVIIDYELPDVLPRREFELGDLPAAESLSIGEPSKLFFTPEQISIELKSFHAIEDLDPTAVHARYCGNRNGPADPLARSRRIVSAWR